MSILIYRLSCSDNTSLIILQYGFRFSRTNAEILTIISEMIYQDLDENREYLAVTLDIMKDFDRHSGLIHKLKSYSVSGHFQLIEFSLSNNETKIILNGH